MTREKSREIFEKGTTLMPGGVNSPARAFGGVGGTPVVFERAKGAEMFDVDGNAYLLEMAEKVKADIAASAGEIPHLKLLAWEPEGDYGKVDLIGTEKPIEVTHSFENRCKDIAVLLNASGVTSADKLEEIVTAAAASVSEKYGLELMIFKSESMGMG